MQIMTKTFFLCIFLVIELTMVDGRCAAGRKVLSISSGTSFGKCLGYCLQSINITSQPAQLTASKEPNGAQTAYPPVQKTYPFSSEKWEELIGLVDFNDFDALDERIGCPDCADGGAEWIEVHFKKSNKRVTFEYGKSIAGFEKFIEKLRQLRKTYLDSL